MKHTKGKWEVDEIRGCKVVVCGSMVIASDLFDENEEPSIEELDANANLIASAPDMLEALNKIYELPLEGGIVGDLRGNYDYNAEMKEWSIKVRRIAKEQITKAEGNEKNK